MLKFISKNNILTPFQYGFRENNSTELAITAFYDKLLKNLNENKNYLLYFSWFKKSLWFS